MAGRLPPWRVTPGMSYVSYIVLCSLFNKSPAKTSGDICRSGLYRIIAGGRMYPLFPRLSYIAIFLQQPIPLEPIRFVRLRHPILYQEFYNSEKIKNDSYNDCVPNSNVTSISKLRSILKYLQFIKLPRLMIFMIWKFRCKSQRFIPTCSQLTFD